MIIQIKKITCALVLLCSCAPVWAHINEELEELNKLKEKLRQVRIARVNDKVDSYNKLKSMEMKVYSIEDKLTELKTKKIDMEEKLNILESEREKIKSEYNELDTKEKELKNFLNDKINEMKQRIENLSPFHKIERLKKISQVENFAGLFKFLEEEISLGESSGFFQDIVNGKNVKILKIGGIFSIYKSPTGEIGLLEKRKKRDEIIYFWNKNIKSSLRKKLADVFQSEEKKPFRLPFDVTQGRKLKEKEMKRGFFAWFVKGGPVMIPIILVALSIIIMAIERFIFFRREYINADKLMEKVLELESVPGHKDEAVKLCESTPGPVARMLKTGLRQHQKGKKIVEEMVHEQHLEEIPRLEKHLSTIAVLAGMSPLLGLLGTVSGMISTFHVITYHGGGDPRLLAGGISEALITTEFGLIIAIPAMLLHNYLSNKADKIAEDLEKNAVKLINSLPD